jgi:hypothetical protein
MGVLNPYHLSTTYLQELRNPAGLAGNVGIVSQSGGFCISLLSDTRRFGFSHVVSSGNEAVLAAADYLEYLVEDPRTEAIGAFIETIRQPDRFTGALDRAAAMGKPIVVLKVGRSERTRRAVSTHTGAANGMTLPAGHARHLVHRCPLGQTQHRNHHVLLGGSLQVGLRLGIRQGLDCRPQLIDQRVAVANFLSLFDTGQSVPQRQQPLGAERGSVQLLIRCNGNLAVIDCPRRLAAQRDPVTANDIDAHEWVLLIDPAAVPP